MSIKTFFPHKRFCHKKRSDNALLSTDTTGQIQKGNSSLTLHVAFFGSLGKPLTEVESIERKTCNLLQTLIFTFDNYSRKANM